MGGEEGREGEIGGRRERSKEMDVMPLEDLKVYIMKLLV